MILSEESLEGLGARISSTQACICWGEANTVSLFISISCCRNWKKKRLKKYQSPDPDVYLCTLCFLLCFLVYFCFNKAKRISPSSQSCRGVPEVPGCSRGSRPPPGPAAPVGAQPALSQHSGGSCAGVSLVAAQTIGSPQRQHVGDKEHAAVGLAGALWYGKLNETRGANGAGVEGLCDWRAWHHLNLLPEKPRGALCLASEKNEVKPEQRASCTVHKQVNTKWIGPGEAGEGAYHLCRGVMESHFVVVCAELARSLPRPAGCPGLCRGGWEELGSLQPSNPGLCLQPLGTGSCRSRY